MATKPLTVRTISRLLEANATGSGMSLEEQKIVLEQLLEVRKRNATASPCGILFDRLHGLRNIQNRLELLMPHVAAEVEIMHAMAVDSEQVAKAATK